jgi:hypothetical protein
VNNNDGPKLMLTLDGNAISAKEFWWVSGELCGCAALLTDGSERLFTEVAFPTEAQFYFLDESIHALPFEEKRKMVLEVTGLDDRDELPWLKYDDAGNTIDEQIEPDLLEAWLFKTVSDDRLENWGSHTASQYAAGFEIINSLDATDSRSLGLHEVDLGGPASSVPCVAITASIDEFNQMMDRFGTGSLIPGFGKS